MLSAVPRPCALRSACNSGFLEITGQHLRYALDLAVIQVEAAETAAQQPGDSVGRNDMSEEFDARQADVRCQALDLDAAQRVHFADPRPAVAGVLPPVQGAGDAHCGGLMWTSLHVGLLTEIRTC